MEILRLVAEGLENADIAARLKVTPSTVGNTLSLVYARLNVDSRVAAARWYWQKHPEQVA